MTTLTTLIINELKDVLGHEPTKKELDSLSEYMGQQDIKFLVDLEWHIREWSKIFTHECAWCEERYLHTEMIITPGGTRFCSDQCAKDYKEEHGGQ